MNKKLVSIIILLILPLAAAKSFDIMESSTEMQIHSNGTISVTEKLEVKFYGDFSYGYRDIPIEDEEISNIKVFIDGEEVSTDISWEGNKKHIHYDMDVFTDKRNIKITYTLNNALKSYNDVNELYWKVWGEQWDDSPEKFTATIELPEPVSNKSNFKTWGHPDLEDTQISSDKQKAVFMVENVPEHQWVEARVIFPREILESTEGAKEIDEKGLPGIIKQEKRFQTKESILSTVWDVIWGIAFLLLLVVPLAMIIIFIHLYKKHGEEPDVDYKGIYEHEPPFDYQPAYVGTLLNLEEQKPTSKDFMASILYLADKNYLELQKVTSERKVLGIFDSEEEDNRIVFTGKGPQDLPKSLRDLYYFIQDFATKSDKYENLGVTFNKLEEKALEKPEEFHEFFKKWKGQVEEEAKDKDFFGSKKGQKQYKILVGASGLFFFLSFLISMSIGLLIPLSFFVTAYFLEATVTGGILLKGLSGALPRRTKKGAMHYEKWKAFKKYVEDFGNLKDYPPAHVTLWEQYLIYATSLGTAEKVIDDMEVVFEKPTENSNIYASGNVHNYTSVGFSSSLSTFSSSGTFAGASGGAGGAGGFSGGGGFGGGGGGGGFG